MCQVWERHFSQNLPLSNMGGSTVKMCECREFPGLCSGNQTGSLLVCSEYLPLPHGTHVLSAWKVLIFDVKKPVLQPEEHLLSGHNFGA